MHVPRGLSGAAGARFVPYWAANCQEGQGGENRSLVLEQRARVLHEAQGCTQAVPLDASTNPITEHCDARYRLGSVFGGGG